MEMLVEVIYDNGVEKIYSIPTNSGITQSELTEGMKDVVDTIKTSYRDGTKCYLNFGNLTINVVKTCSINFKLR